MVRNKSFTSVSLVLIASMMLALVACSPAATPIPTGTPTTVPSQTSAPTFTPTITSTPLPTSTPTFTPTPTKIPTQTPSPTPEGFYSSQVLGLSLILPKGWQVPDKEGGGVRGVIQDPVSKSMFMVQTFEDNGKEEFDAYIDPIIKAFRGLFTYSTLSKKSEIKLGDGSTGVMQMISGKSTSGVDLVMQVAFARLGTRVYFFDSTVFGPSMKDNAELVDGIYKSIYLAKNPDDILTIKIASQSPLSGNMSSVGQDIKNGAELALAQSGDSLRSMGFRLEMVPYDDQGSPDAGVANAKQIVADPAILCVVGHFNSGVQIPSSEVYHTANLANVSPANTNPKVTDRGYKEVSRIVGRDDMQGIAGARFAKFKGIKTAYVLDDTTVYGSGIAKAFTQEAGTLDIQVLGSQETTEMNNFDALLEGILPAKPDLIYFGGMYNQIAEFFKQARQKGFQGMFLSTDGFDSSDSATIGGKALLEGKGTYFSVVAGPASVYEGAGKFIADFKAKFNHDPQPFAAQGYDAMGICLKAIEYAAKTNGNKMPTRAAVTDAVRALKDYAGITGTINFNKNGDLVQVKYFVIQVISADPARWGYNRIVQRVPITPP